MDSPRYDIYLTGKLAEGVSPEAASRQLAALFKATPEAMAALLTGKPQLLKRGLDKAAALKYREALQSAGVLVAFKAQVPEQQPAATAQTPEPVPVPTQAPSQPQTQPQPQNSAPAPAAATIALAPTGGELLSPEERSRPPVANVDISGYELAPVGALPAAPETTVAAPATDHISLAPAGSEVLTEAERERPEMPSPDIGDLSLAEPGTRLADTAAAPPPPPDTSHISLAAADAGPLAGVRPPPPPAPNTDHLGLADA